MKKFFLGSTVFMICLLFIGCGEKSETTMGLQWSKLSPNSMDHLHALLYCQDLEEDGHNDWKLPNIDELRTLIKNCSKTEKGGSCKVGRECKSRKCTEPINSCSCEKESNYSKLGDGGVNLWSQSRVSDLSGYYWEAGFHNGSIHYFKEDFEYYVRCVR